jgi:hypothetical protein
VSVLARHAAVFMDRLLLQYQPPPSWRAVRAVVFFGDTRTGKSRLAADILRSLFPGQRPYSQHQVVGRLSRKGVIMDDFGGDAANPAGQPADGRAAAALDGRAGVPD